MLDIQGWIEVDRSGEPEDGHAWQAVINIGPLIDTPDLVSERLFGLSKDYATARSDDQVAGRRGLPANPSQTVTAELLRIKQHESQFERGEFGGYTHATWREIKAAPLDDQVVRRSDWQLIFSLCERLEQDSRLSDNRIRFVVWYCW